MNNQQIRLTESDLKQIVKESVAKILNEIEGQEPVNTNTQQPQMNNTQQQQAQQQNNQLSQYQQAIWKFCQQVAKRMMDNEKAMQRIDKGVNAIWQTLQYQQRGQQYGR
jgi:N-acetylglutamate synthase/N-acetylornithine aminotransferase